MPESLVQVTSGAGPKLHTFQRTVGANNVEDEFTVPGEYPYASYTLSIPAVSVATVNDHLLQVMAGASLPVRVRRIRIEQLANATAVTIDSFALLRLTTAGTGGTAFTPRPLDTADAASGATAIQQPGVKGTEGVELRRESLVLRQAVLATGTQPEETIEWVWTPANAAKSPTIPAGAANGLVVKNLVAVAGATVNIYVELVEMGY